MLDPQFVVRGIRRDLKQIVLPAVCDDHARAVTLAAIGILGSLATGIREAEEWHAETVAELLPAAAGWEAMLTHAPRDASAVRSLRLQADACATTHPRGARAALMEAAEIVVRVYWRDGGAISESALDGLRSLLAADLTRQLQITGSLQGDAASRSES
jgi:hypothetical protein